MNHRPEQENDSRVRAAFDAARADAARIPSPDSQRRARDAFLRAARQYAVSPNGHVRHNDQVGAPPEVTKQTKVGERPMLHRFSRPTRLIAAVLLGVIVAGILWTSPTLRALTQEILDFFIPAATDTQPDSVFVSGGAPPPDASTTQQSLEDVAVGARFEIWVPTYLPNPYHFEGGEVLRAGQNIDLRYACREPWILLIEQAISDEPPIPFEVGASAVIEEVPIHDVIGQYVRGMWQYEVDPAAVEQARSNTLDGTPQQVPATRVWENETDWQQLQWRESGINFIVQTGGGIIGNDTPNPCALTKDDYIAIAESMQPISAAQ